MLTLPLMERATMQPTELDHTVVPHSHTQQPPKGTPRKYATSWGPCPSSFPLSCCWQVDSKDLHVIPSISPSLCFLYHAFTCSLPRIWGPLSLQIDAMSKIHGRAMLTPAMPANHTLHRFLSVVIQIHEGKSSITFPNPSDGPHVLSTHTLICSPLSISLP